jgi:hypothetical protein
MQQAGIWAGVGAIALAGAIVFASLRPQEETPPPPSVPSLVPPLCDAQVGEWERLEAGALAEVYRVVEASEETVTIESVRYSEGTPVGPPEPRVFGRNGFGLPQGYVVQRIDPDRIDVGGTMRDCWRIAATSQTGARFWWISEAVPACGILKIAQSVRGQPDEPNAARLADSGNE